MDNFGTLADVGRGLPDAPVRGDGDIALCEQTRPRRAGGPGILNGEFKKTLNNLTLQLKNCMLS